MKVERTERGFEFIKFTDSNSEPCGLQQSSAVGGYRDSLDRPGTSFLWLGIEDDRMHLSREQVAELIPHLQAWLATGSLTLPEAQ